MQAPTERNIPEELQLRREADPLPTAGFESLTPGRRKSFIFHILAAKQGKTRAARAEGGRADDSEWAGV